MFHKTIGAQSRPEPSREGRLRERDRFEEMAQYGHSRLCGTRLVTTCVDLGMSPLCESFLTPDRANQREPYFPLHALVCGTCFLVQLQEYVKPTEIFAEYAYFSSYSTSWVEHARRYCEMIAKRLDLNAHSNVFE